MKATDDVSIDLRAGEIHAIIGPNGAGKTSTLRMRLDIIKPTSGKLEVLGSTSAITIRSKIGYLPEERGLYRKMTAAKSIRYFAELRGVPKDVAKERAYALLEKNGLGAFSDTRNDSLSKGMAQKVQLLSTIAHDPDLLILDEPFSGLDPINQQSLEELIMEQKNLGKTIIFSTHVMQHAERLCDRFLILARGAKAFEGTLEEAQEKFSRRIHLRGKFDEADLQSLDGVLFVEVRKRKREGSEGAFDVILEETTDPQSILTQLVGKGLSVTRFEVAGATLHDIFVELAGDPEADPASTTSFAKAAE